MPLCPPKRSPAGFVLAVEPPIESPPLRWNSGWACTDEWASWASGQRTVLLEELLSHANWFSRPPRREIIEPIFSPWASTNMQGVRVLSCITPDIPAEGSGVAVWKLMSINMSPTSITPVWTLASFQKDEKECDTISLFGEGDTIDESSDTENREICFDDIQEAPSSAPTKLRSRESDARKFLAKERVREARLKAQIANHIARKEESRYYEQFGDPEDGESHISDYDLSEESENEKE